MHSHFYKERIYSMKQTIVVPLVIGVVALGGGFIGGIKYQEYRNTKTMQSRFSGMRNQVGDPAMMGNRMQNVRGGMQMNFRPLNGEVLKKDETSLTVKTMDGSSKIVLLAESTVVSESKTSSIQDVVVGSKVAVFGSSNTDGSITAQSVQLNPSMNMFGTQTGIPKDPSVPEQKQRE
jgi:hypothetical protein